MPFFLKDAGNAFIVGAGHGIGYAIVQALNIQCPDLKIWGTYHDEAKASELLNLSRSQSNIEAIQLDVTSEMAIERVVKQLKNEIGDSSLDICLIACGILHDDSMRPEKSLSDINKKNLLKYFEINSIVTPLIAKHIKSLYSTKKNSLFACLSAKVGSISDNSLGGWYGYRASKAALNMFLKTISLEYKMAQLKTIALALHPGTTETSLSAPFLKNIKHQVFTQEQTASHLLSVLEKLDMTDSGTFKNWDGNDLPW